MKLEQNKSTWKIPDLFNAFFAISSNFQLFMENKKNVSSVTEKEIGYIEETANYLRGIMEVSEEKGHQIEDPVFYWYLLTANVLILESKYREIINDGRLSQFRGTIAKNEIPLFSSKLDTLVENDDELDWVVFRCKQVALSAQKGITFHKVYPSYTEDDISLILSSARKYALLTNDNWIALECNGIKGITY